jgi:predicted DNA-binding protein
MPSNVAQTDTREGPPLDANVSRNLNMRVSPELYDAIADAADREGRTVSNWVRRAIQEKLEAAEELTAAEAQDVQEGLVQIRRGETSTPEELEQRRMAVR